MSFYKKLMSSILSGVLIFSAVGSVSAADSDQVALEEAGLENDTYISEEQAKDLEEVFAAVETLPEDVINEGDEAVVDYLQDNVSDGVVVKEEGDVVAFGNVFPIAKITKLKSIIKTAGGATTFTKTLIKSYNSARKFKATKSAAIKIAVKAAAKKSGPDTVAAVIEIFNVGSVYSACFE